MPVRLGRLFNILWTQLTVFPLLVWISTSSPFTFIICPSIQTYSGSSTQTWEPITMFFCMPCSSWNLQYYTCLRSKLIHKYKFSHHFFRARTEHTHTHTLTSNKIEICYMHIQMLALVCATIKGKLKRDFMF